MSTLMEENVKGQLGIAHFWEMKFGIVPRRRDWASREGGCEGGIPLPSRLGGLGERRELPQWGPEPKTNLGHIKRHRTPVAEGKLGISSDIYIGLLDRYWASACKVAGPAKKTSRQPGYFQVSRVSCIGSKGLQLRTRPVSMGDRRPPVHNIL